METKRAKLTLVLATAVLLLVLAVGTAAPSVAGVMQVPGTLHGLLAEPHAGGGSDGG